MPSPKEIGFHETDVPYNPLDESLRIMCPLLKVALSLLSIKML